MKEKPVSEDIIWQTQERKGDNDLAWRSQLKSSEAMRKQALAAFEGKEKDKYGATTRPGDQSDETGTNNSADEE